MPIDDDAEVLQVGADRAERLADGELDVAAEQRGDRLGAALRGDDLDLESVLLEDARLDRAPEGAGLGDGQRGDADRGELAAVGVVGGSGGRGGAGIGAAG